MSSVPQKSLEKMTVIRLQEKKRINQMISMLTAYDYAMAQAVDQAGLDSILVGDSLGMVVLGYETTLPVTMADMLHHCRAVARGARRALLIGDMPFMSYQASVPEAVGNAGRFLQEAGMDAVKLEGGRERSEAIRAICAAGIPVMGHLGLTPQSIRRLGSFRPQARSVAGAIRLVEDAHILQDAGCFALVVESIPAQLGTWVSQQLTIPVIGISAGAGCDGQVLVTHDLLGLFEQFTPRFVKQYADLARIMAQAFNTYQQEIEQHSFPADEHTLQMKDELWAQFLKQVEVG